MEKDHLNIINLAKFTKRLLSIENWQKYQDIIDSKTMMNEEDKINYFNSVRVVVCEQTCPCCGRICGLVNNHQYHQCIYGHQMRGLNGTFLKGTANR